MLTGVTVWFKNDLCHELIEIFTVSCKGIKVIPDIGAKVIKEQELLFWERNSGRISLPLLLLSSFQGG